MLVEQAVYSKERRRESRASPLKEEEEFSMIKHCTHSHLSIDSQENKGEEEDHRSSKHNRCQKMSLSTHAINWMHAIKGSFLSLRTPMRASGPSFFSFFSILF